MVRGSTDIFAINHYSTNYVADAKSPPPATDMSGNVVFTAIGEDGKPIGPQGESAWLHVVPWGFHAVLKWITRRYDSPHIIVTENGGRAASC